MINAIHAVIYSKEAEAVRAFFRDVLQFPAVDAGHGWLIFALPPAEVGVHPTDSPSEDGKHQLYLMCDDVQRTVDELTAKGVEFTQPIRKLSFGYVTAMKIPGGEIHLYQRTHSSPLTTRPPD